MAEACHESPEITAPTTPKRCSRTFPPRYLQGASTCDSIPTVTTTIEERFPRPSVMGVVNVTPDSFSDGGANLDPDDAAATARRMVAEGAAIVDVGGESTRPGSAGVTVDEELRRIVPVLERLGGEVPLSIDTAKAEVARRALALGAELVNDVTALRGDPELAGVVADAGCYVCLMHMQGEPRTMQEQPDLRRTSLPRSRRSSRSGSVSPWRRASTSGASASIPESASARPSSRTSSSSRASTCS